MTFESGDRNGRDRAGRAELSPPSRANRAMPIHCYAVAWWMVELTTSPLCTLGVPSITLAKVFTTSG
jgi:hypothetical protein